MFTEGQQFRRTKSPIYLQWSKGIASSSEEKPAGFQIHSFKTKAHIGFVSTALNEQKESVEFSSILIEDTTVGAEVFRTLTGVFKASKSKLPLEIKYLCYACSLDNKEIIAAALEASFKRKIAIPNCFHIHLEKAIPTPEPILSQSAKSTQVPLSMRSRTIASGSRGDDIPQFLPTPHLSTIFKVGDTFHSKSTSSIYLMYAAEIDIENVMEVPMKEFGFKIFRSHEKDEIGYIVSNYLQKLGDIRIGAIWINKDMRCKGYGSKAMTTLVSLYTSKKIYFPEAKYFSFFTTRNNKAMLEVAQKVDFVNANPLGKQQLMALFSGMFFKKHFDNGK
ncbi:MAG: GNAT family N-acetyltransferase [Alphaproteobacteria bacterium]|nr:GNAT family N-acetyltransferase [Alphaproteobacteria bacterium]